MTERPRPELDGDVIPDSAEFAGWPPGGSGSVELSAGPVRVRLRGVDRDVERACRHWIGPWPEPAPAGKVDVDVEVCRSGRPEYLRVAEGPDRRCRLETWCEGSALAMVTHHAALLVDGEVRAGLGLLADVQGDELRNAVQNLLRVAVAWALARTGTGLLLHAAAVEHEGRAVLFLGPSGAGKTTAVRRSAPRRVLADDVVVVQSPEGREPWTAVTSPLWASGDFPGRIAEPGLSLPLGLACALRRTARTEIDRMAGARAAVAVAGVAPFLTPGAGFDVAGPAAAMVRQVPTCSLGCSLSEDFWPALEASPVLAGAGPGVGRAS